MTVKGGWCTVKNKIYGRMGCVENTQFGRCAGGLRKKEGERVVVTAG